MTFYLVVYIIAVLQVIAGQHKLLGCRRDASYILQRVPALAGAQAGKTSSAHRARGIAQRRPRIFLQ